MPLTPSAPIDQLWNCPLQSPGLAPVVKAEISAKLNLDTLSLSQPQDQQVSDLESSAVPAYGHKVGYESC